MIWREGGWTEDQLGKFNRVWWIAGRIEQVIGFVA